MMLQANKLLTLFNLPLQGGVAINLAPIVDEANKNIEECTNYWRDTNTMSRIWTIA